MDILAKLQKMQQDRWTWIVRGTDMPNARVVIAARRSPYGRMYGYGEDEAEAWRMFDNMIKDRTEELVLNGIFCEKCVGRGTITPPGVNQKDTCPDCGGDGKGPVQREKEAMAAEG